MNAKAILIIEDNQLNMKLVKSLLQLGNYPVLEAADAEQGIQVARQNQPGLILMDIQLPGIDGLEATRIIRNDATLCHIPILALTSYAMQGDHDKAIAAGCNGYITKPIDTRSFLKVIEQYYQ
jgi:CheY-like chemotaxis protein